MAFRSGPITLGPAYNEFGYNELLATMSRCHCIKIIDSNVKKFGYNEHPLVTSGFLCIFLLIVSRTQCVKLQEAFDSLLKTYGSLFNHRGFVVRILHDGCSVSSLVYHTVLIIAVRIH